MQVDVYSLIRCHKMGRFAKKQAVIKTKTRIDWGKEILMICGSFKYNLFALIYETTRFQLDKCRFGCFKIFKMTIYTELCELRYGNHLFSMYL